MNRQNAVIAGYDLYTDLEVIKPLWEKLNQKHLPNGCNSWDSVCERVTMLLKSHENLVEEVKHLTSELETGDIPVGALPNYIEYLECVKRKLADVSKDVEAFIDNLPCPPSRFMVDVQATTAPKIIYSFGADMLKTEMVKRVDGIFDAVCQQRTTLEYRKQAEKDDVTSRMLGMCEMTTSLAVFATENRVCEFILAGMSLEDYKVNVVRPPNPQIENRSNRQTIDYIFGHDGGYKTRADGRNLMPWLSSQLTSKCVVAAHSVDDRRTKLEWLLVAANATANYCMECQVMAVCNVLDNLSIPFHVLRENIEQYSPNEAAVYTIDAWPLKDERRTVARFTWHSAYQLERAVTKRWLKPELAEGNSTLTGIVETEVIARMAQDTAKLYNMNDLLSRDWSTYVATMAYARKGLSAEKRMTVVST